MAFDKFRSNWTGASGIQVGYADAYPATQDTRSFTSSPVHAASYNPNQVNSYRQPGALTGDVPVTIQAEQDFIDWGMGQNGWLLDNIDYPNADDAPGTDGHSSAMGPAKAPAPDSGHGQPVFQKFQAPGFGTDFYGQSIDTQDLAAWNSSTTRAPNTGSAILDAREQTSNWPTPFDSTTVAPLLPVVRDTEKIPMRRMKQDDRPLYRQIAVPGMNVKPSGSVYNPTYASNDVLQNVKPIPASYTSPTDPSVSQDALSQVYMDDDSPVIGEGWQ